MLRFSKREFLTFLGIFSIYILILSLVTRTFFIYHLSPQNLLVLGLLGIDFSMPFWAIYIFSVCNFFIFAAVSYKIFKKPFYLYPLLVFSMTFWLHYLTSAISVYIYYLFLTLISFLGTVMLVKKEKNGILLFLFGAVLSVYSFISPLIIYTVILLLLKIFKLIDFRILKKIIIIFFISITPLIIIIKTNQNAFDNIFKNEITLFSDPGLIAESNRLQGDSKKAGFNLHSKLVENKYIYTGKYFVMKFFYHFAPSLYFSPQEKLLNFSFTPPLPLGFLIPAVYGFYLALSGKSRYYCVVLSVLIIPSLLSQKIIDLNRLVVFAPAVILASGFGLIKFSAKKKFFAILFFVIILTQILFIIHDITWKEDIRYHRYFGTNILDNLGRQ